MASFWMKLILLLTFWRPVLAAPEGLPTQWPLHDDGLNQIVQWDHYSFELRSQRTFLFAGEFHYWRLPVPELWVDILQKIKAAGFTALTFYTNWAYHAPNNHTLDFSTEAHDYTPLLKIAKEIGLYVILRPGPYINAEINAGGFPLWLTTGAYGTLRNNDTRYTAAWQPYFAKSSQIISQYQITNGQNVILYQIENEYGEQWDSSPQQRVPNQDAINYMELLEATARSNGINIPLSANEPNMNAISWGSDWSNVGGNVDVTGLDSYPSCWTCDLSVCTGTNGAYIPYEVVDYYDYFLETQPTMPSFMAEFQGGSYNPWGGPEGGCPQNTGPDFANIYYRWNIGQRITAVSLYMLYGGTNWGAMAAPVTATSYDYSSPISEDRSIGDKYYETKLVAMFTRVAQDLTVTNLIGNGTRYTTNPEIRAYELRNPSTNAGFYVTLHTNSSVGTDEVFKLHVTTSQGAITIPRFANDIRLNGYQSKIVVTDFTFGSHTLLYSTAEVLSYTVFDGIPTLALWVPTGETAEFAVKNAKAASVKRDESSSGIQTYQNGGNLAITFTQSRGMTVIELDTGVRVLLLDRSAAYLFWAPALTNDPAVPEDESIFVQGPYLVRSAQITGSTVELTGDVINSTTIEVFAPKIVTSVNWNGQRLQVRGSSYGSLQASLPKPGSINLPALNAWKFEDSLPERFIDYDDSGMAWVDANHMSTLNPTIPASLPVLYADEYGFHNGVRLWRGYFTGSPSGVFLNIQGGYAFGWSAWLNGELIGSYLGNANVESANLTLTFPKSLAKSTGENVLLVVHDDTGHDETSGALNPRGILQATLLSGGDTSLNFTRWRVAGTAGGESNLDPVRGVYNEDGLFAERVGWHLPAFDDSKWPSISSESRVTQLDFTGAGVKFYRTTVPLNIPSGVDVSISFVLSAPIAEKTALRTQLFVNGYQYGRFNPYIGNQVVFPVPPGILDYTGDNTIGLAIWAQTEAGAQVTVDWQVNYVAESSLDVTFDGQGLRPRWSEARLRYA